MGERQSHAAMALAIKDGGDFQHILRILGTNVDGKQKVMYAMTSVKGIGRRFSNIVCKKADVDMDKRAGELTQKEMDDLVNVVQNPNEYKIPAWMLNRRKDFKAARRRRCRRTRSTPSSVTTWSASRRSATTGVCVTTGGSVCAASTPRPRAAVARPWVCPRRRANFHAPSPCYTCAPMLSILSILTAVKPCALLKK